MGFFRRIRFGTGFSSFVRGISFCEVLSALGVEACGGVGGGEDGLGLDFGMGMEDDRSSRELSRDSTSSLAVIDFFILGIDFVVGVLDDAFIGIGFFTDGGEIGLIGWNQAGEFLLGVTPWTDFCRSGDVCRLDGGENALGGDMALGGDIALGGGDIDRGGGDIALLLSGGLGGFMVTVAGSSRPIPGADAYLFSSITSCIL